MQMLRQIPVPVTLNRRQHFAYKKLPAHFDRQIGMLSRRLPILNRSSDQSIFLRTTKSTKDTKALCDVCDQRSTPLKLSGNCPFYFVVPVFLFAS
jgi:hypothetical protein